MRRFVLYARLNMHAHNLILQRYARRAGGAIPAAKIHNRQQNGVRVIVTLCINNVLYRYSSISL